jgi:hypothetical protein
MKPIGRNTVGRIILVVGSVYLVYFIVSYTRPHDLSRADHPNGRAASIPPTQSEYLRDVAEPITMVEGISWDNNGQGLVFKDSRQALKQVCLLFLYEESGDPLKHNLLLGTALPRVQKGRRIPVAGSEEQAFLGLLERWYRNDPEARAIWRRYQAKDDDPLLDQGKSEEYGGKVIAVRILRTLRRRN